MLETHVRTIRIVTAAVLAFTATRSTFAADLLEPFDPGFSDLELHWCADLGADDHGAVGVLGFGLGHGLSLALEVEGGVGERGSSSVSFVYSRSLGRRGELDAWLARGLDGEGSSDLELGFEWSRAFGATVPYLRIGWHPDAEGAAEALVGVAFTREKTDLHFELALGRPEGGDRPLRLAFGPNFPLGAGAELLPELALVRDEATGKLSAELALGIVLVPGALSDPKPLYIRFRP